MSIYKLPLPTDTKLIEGSTEAELNKKNKVIIKLSTKSNDEYNIYKLLEKINHNPNIPKIYGVMSCYEKNEYIKNNLKDLVNKGLCYGNKDKDSTKIYLSIIERIKDSTTLTYIGNNKLPRMQILSLLLQGLFTIYHMFYVFGILHNDFNESNIMLKSCDQTKILEYKFISAPYRYFKFELPGGDDWNKCQKKYTIKTYGVQLYLIDYDQALIYHQYYINVDKISDHPIENAFKYIKTICKYGDEDIYNICKEHFDTRGKHLIDYSQQFLNSYNQDKSDEKNCFMIDRWRITLRMWIKELFKYFPEMKDHDCWIC